MKEKIVEQVRFQCESCGKEYREKSSINTCEFCGKDVCENCGLVGTYFLNTEYFNDCGEQYNTTPICQECYSKLNEAGIEECGFDFEEAANDFNKNLKKEIQEVLG